MRRIRGHVRPLLVGLHNPLSPEPEFALYPLPERGTGGRIADMLRPDFTRSEYLRAFDRVNLLEHDERVSGKEYAARLQRARVRLIEHVVAGRYQTLVLFGADVWGAVAPVARPARPQWLRWDNLDVVDRGVGWRVRFLTLPHPSGRNLWYNNSANRAAASRALRELAAVSLA